MHTLYKLDFASGKSYIGQTTRTMNIRMQAHAGAARNGSQLAVHCAWRKYGKPIITVIAELSSQDELHIAEIEAIKNMKTLSPDGYNVGYGGETAPSKHPEVRAKISAKGKGRKYSDTSAWAIASKEHWQDGEYRKKVSDGLKAAWTDEKRKARSEMFKDSWAKRKAAGYKMSDETKEKLASYDRTDESRAKMSASAKARRREARTDESKKKVSKITGSSWADPEIRAKRVAGMILAHAKRKQERLQCP